MTRINREIWQTDSFSWKKPHPPWQCPICKHGTLHGDRKTIKIEKSQDTIKARRIASYNKEGDAIFRFAGFLVCQNNQCNERIVVAGNGVLCAESTDTPVNINYQGDRISVFYPKFFEPALNIFLIHESCPQEIELQIKKSFSHFFNDANACANAIRTSLELIMDEQGVPNKNEKGNQIYLGPRIDKFKDINPELKPLVEAVKWIGNAGSHIDNINKGAILDGYELLQFIIHELYEKKARMNELSIKANQINTAKKPSVE